MIRLLRAAVVLGAALAPLSASAQDACQGAPLTATVQQVGETLVIRGRPSRPTVGAVRVDVETGLPTFAADAYGLYRPSVVVPSTAEAPELVVPATLYADWAVAGGPLPDTMPGLEWTPDVGSIYEATPATGIWVLPG